ncbi:polysaccharide lyase [Pelotalea chapellei]|uniref:Polysaccharide lyase-like protein n=1 Tax=Pelotalea chapellei TaxID=44671 RepID=A0ABS5U825_9BACT|nr:polysaccharide lyase [Pelotalea chapellei]MBT1071823.1 hypothetical protein [Pelotalea chapellei]
MTAGTRTVSYVLQALMIVTLLSAGQAFAWTRTATFENEGTGSIAQGSTAFEVASGSTTITTDKVSGGSKAAKMYHAAGDGGVMGYVSFPGAVGNGGEIWARGNFYFASPWNWACNPVIKVLRGAHIANASGGNVGYLSVFADAAGNIVLSNEPAGVQKLTSAKFDVDKWQTIEMYVKLSTGSATFRIWKNGVLILEDTARTINSTSDYADFSYIMSNWNGGSPQNQTQYIDDFIWTNTTPSQKDSAGRPMIGPTSGTGTGTTTLAAPTGFRIISK